MLFMSFNGKVILYQGVLATAPFYRCMGAACCISVKWLKSIKRLDIEVDSGARLVQECWARARKWLSACLVCILQLKVIFTFHFSSYLKTIWIAQSLLSPSRLWSWMQYKWFTVYSNLSTELIRRIFLTIFSNSTLIFSYSTFLCEVASGL